MKPETVVPKGYIENHEGALVRLDRLSELDLARNEVVTALCKDAQSLQEMMREYRMKAFAAMNQYLDLVFSSNNVKRSDKLGNHIVYSYDGNYKVVLQRGSQMKLSEQFAVAEELLLDLIKDWTRPDTEDLVAVVQNSLTRRNGELDVVKVLELRQLKVKDPKWIKAMDIIGDCLSRIYTKQYIRFYQRCEDGSYSAIVLDFASL